jgi:hypothetical protein
MEQKQIGRDRLNAMYSIVFAASYKERVGRVAGYRNLLLGLEPYSAGMTWNAGNSQLCRDTKTYLVISKVLQPPRVPPDIGVIA